MLPLLSLLFILLVFLPLKVKAFSFFFSPILFFLFSMELGNSRTLMAALFFIILKSQMGFLLDVDMFMGLFTAFQGC